METRECVHLCTNRMSKCILSPFSTAGISHLHFYTKRHAVHSGYKFFCQYVCSLGIEPTIFVLLTKCSTTEPQEHTFYLGTRDFGPVLSVFPSQEPGSKYISGPRYKFAPYKVLACEGVLFQRSGTFGGGTWALSRLIG